MDKTRRRGLETTKDFVVHIEGRIRFQGAADPLVPSGYGDVIASAVRDGVGRYTITLAEPVPTFLRFDAHERDPGGSLYFARGSSGSALGTAGTYAFATLDATGAAVDPPNTAFLDFALVVRNSSVST